MSTCINRCLQKPFRESMAGRKTQDRRFVFCDGVKSLKVSIKSQSPKPYIVTFTAFCWSSHKLSLRYKREYRPQHTLGGVSKSHLTGHYISMSLPVFENHFCSKFFILQRLRSEKGKGSFKVIVRTRIQTLLVLLD